MNQIIAKMFKHAVKSCAWGTEVALSSQAYQMELEVDCLMEQALQQWGTAEVKSWGGSYGVQQKSWGRSCYEADMVPGGT